MLRNTTNGAEKIYVPYPAGRLDSLTDPLLPLFHPRIHVQNARIRKRTTQHGPRYWCSDCRSTAQKVSLLTSYKAELRHVVRVVDLITVLVDSLEQAQVSDNQSFKLEVRIIIQFPEHQVPETQDLHGEYSHVAFVAVSILETAKVINSWTAEVQ